MRNVLVPLAVVGLLLAFGPLAYDRIEASIVERYEYGAQGTDRIMLWRYGLEAMAASPLTGLGPGSHSGFSDPFAGRESHNSLIDWGASAGLLGLLAYAALVGWLVRRIWRARDALLMAALSAVLMVSLFHFTFRHPVFWFSLLFIAALTGASGKRRASRLPTASPCAD